jgi:hypothetical protein
MFLSRLLKYIPDEESALDQRRNAPPSGGRPSRAETAEPLRYVYHGPLVSRALDLLELGKWLVRGCPAVLPDILKRRVVAGYARRFRLDTFVESGTYLGAMVDHMSNYCPTVYSFEYQERLWKRATERFANRAGVHILRGSGADLMPSVLAQMQTPGLFWLDGHFASGTTAPHEVACPTMEELTAVLRHRSDHVVLIDDAREFRGEGGYPTVGGVVEAVRSLRPGMHVQASQDIIRITPAPPC